MAALRHKKHIFFDLDDTLWDFRKNSSAALSELYVAHALEEKLGVNFGEFILRYEAVNLRYWSDYSNRRITKEYLRNQRFHEVFMHFNYNNYEESLDVSRKYIGTAPVGKHLKENCLEILTWLKNDYSLHIITNGFKDIAAHKIDACGLRSFFSNIIISEEHDMFKPDVRIFRLAENLSSATAEECVMIGDSLESDIEGALSAGWHAIYFSSEKPEAYKGAHIKSLSELRSYF